MSIVNDNLNNHEMYYEIHGSGPPAICMGGWGTFCHGGENRDISPVA